MLEIILALDLTCQVFCGIFFCNFIITKRRSVTPFPSVKHNLVLSERQKISFITTRRQSCGKSISSVVCLSVHGGGEQPCPAMFNLDLTVQSSPPQAIFKFVVKLRPHCKMMFKRLHYEARTVCKQVVGIPLKMPSYFIRCPALFTRVSSHLKMEWNLLIHSIKKMKSAANESTVWTCRAFTN